jgi:hypothetical protein
MADVVDAFMRGHAFAQAESAHEQQLEENKLRTQVLKHQIDSIKIEDQLRARELARQNLELQQGQPNADLPQEGVDQTNLPSRSLAGVVNGLIQARQGLMTTPGQDTATGTNAAPSFTPAPAAQDTTPGTTTVSRPAAVNIPGVDALGVPGVSVRPRSLEDLIRARAQEELTKPYNLGPGEKRFVGGQVVAEGGRKLQPVGVGGLVDESNNQVVVPGRGAAPARPVAGVYNGQTVFGQPQPDGTFTVNGQPAPGFKPRPSAAEEDKPERDAQRQLTNDRLRYNEDVSVAMRRHAEAYKAWQKKADTAVNGVDTATGKPLGDEPTYTPPTFEEWQAAHPPAAKGARGAKPAAGGKTITQPSDPLQAADPATGVVYRFPTPEAAAGYRREKGIK